ncbi:MAG: type II toxin-antitoxin system VapC family toxin [Planctomycetota bacterium]|nr:type II toxin-antitoxin system VapC family toxin [Planctomycetota bacterium]
MKLLLDTHAFLWMSLDDPQLSKTARENLADTENDLFLSPASYWEIAIKISIGKYTLAEPLVEFVGREMDANELNVLPVTVEHAGAVSGLPFHHKDPFDRMLVAQATLENMSLISCDVIFDQYGVTRIW